MDTFTGFTYLDANAKSLNSTSSTTDDSFGPFLKIPDTTTFDFTLLFEESVLSVLPSGLFLLLLPPRIWQLWRSPRKVTGSYLLTAKIVCLHIYILV